MSVDRSECSWAVTTEIRTGQTRKWREKDPTAHSHQPLPFFYAQSVDTQFLTSVIRCGKIFGPRNQWVYCLHERLMSWSGQVFWPWAEPTNPRARPNPQQLELGKEGTRTEKPVCVLYWWISQVIHELNVKTENDGTVVLYIRNVWSNWLESIYWEAAAAGESQLNDINATNSEYVLY